MDLVGITKYKWRFIYPILSVLLIAFSFFLVPESTLFKWGVEAERRFAGMSEKSLLLNEGKISYLEGGKGEVLLLLHGFGANKDNWNRLAFHLTDNYRVIALDLPGFGESYKNGELNYGVQQQANRVSEFVEKLQLKQLHIAGNSMGGFIAGNFAAKYPEKTKSLWLLNPLGATSPQESEMFAAVRRGERPYVLVNNEAQMKTLLEKVFYEPPFIPSAVVSQLAIQAAENYDLHKDIFYSIHRIASNGISFDLPLEQSLVNFDKPIFVVWGAEDKILHWSGSHTMANLGPHVQVSIIEHMGHLPMLESPKAIAHLFEEFQSSLNN